MTSPAVYAAAGRWTSTQIKDWSPTWREHLAHWLEPSCSLVGDAAWGAQYRDMVQLPVPDPLAWANRHIELADGHWAIAGIRFRGQDIEKPFVDIIATSLSPDPSGLTALGEVLPHFSAFSPLCLRVNLPDPELGLGLRALDESSTGAVHTTPDLLIVARPVAEMLEQPLARRYDEVALVPCEPEFAAECVAAIYADLQPLRPNLDQWATPADADSLEDAAEQGLLFDIQVSGASAGIVAAERDDSYGLAGFCMQEVAVDHAHRGHGVGVAALQRLSRELPSNADDVLWGHIHPDNIPSLRNAQVSGRKVVTAHVWITPEGYGGMPS